MLVHTTYFIPLLLMLGFWAFIVIVVFLSFQSLRGIQRSLAEIAETLRTKS